MMGSRELIELIDGWIGLLFVIELHCGVKCWSVEQMYELSSVLG